MAFLYACFLLIAKCFPDLMAILPCETEPFCDVFGFGGSVKICPEMPAFLEMLAQWSPLSVITSESGGCL